MKFYTDILLCGKWSLQWKMENGQVGFQMTGISVGMELLDGAWLTREKPSKNNGKGEANLSFYHWHQTVCCYYYCCYFCCFCCQKAF